MATIKKCGNGYHIRCYDGRDQNGKQIEHSMTWKVPAGMTPKKAEKEAMRQAVLFEEQVKKGLVAEQKTMKFADFGEKWFADYAGTQLRPRTIDGYRRLMGRIYPAFGNMYIDRIRPAHLVQFYRELSETSKPKAYKCLIDIKAALRVSGESMASLSLKKHVSLPTLKSAANGRRVSLQNAVAISNALGMKFKDIFEESEPTTLSTGTIGKYHRVLSSMFQTAVEWGIITANPCDRVSPPKNRTARNGTQKFLTAEQSVEMLKKLENEPPYYKNAITLLLFTGMRRGELLGLEWEDFNEENGTLDITKSVQYIPGIGVFDDDTKTESSNRVIKLSQTAINALKAQKTYQDEMKQMFGEEWHGSKKIFTTPIGDGIRPDTLTGWFTDFMKRSGLPPIHLHNLRHTNATLQIVNGSSVTTVAGYLGHASANTTTRIYAHAIQEAQAKSAEMLDDILNPKS